MLSYNLRLAYQSLRRTPGIAALMIGAIALGVGVCVTSLTVYRLQSGNPIAHRNDVLYSVTLDSWGADEPADDERPLLPPPQMTYRDTMALSESDIPDRQAVMRKGAFVLDPITTEGVRPFSVLARFTTEDFFAMFDVPFAFGGGWDQAADRDAESVVVLSKETNIKAFGGGNSVGKTLRLDGRDYKVIGVLDEWEPIPKFYDLNNNPFESPEAIFVPLAVGTNLEMVSGGSTNCWRRSRSIRSRISWAAIACGCNTGSSSATPTSWRRSRISSITTCASRRSSGVSSDRSTITCVGLMNG